MIYVYFEANTYYSSVVNGKFKRNDTGRSLTFGHARAADLMSTQSAMGFKWSVKLIGDKSFHVGITSKLTSGSFLSSTDRNAILYSSNDNSPQITIGNDTIHSNLPKQKTGDVIHFEFQPVAKKLIIELVRVCFFNVSRPSTRDFRTKVTKSICATIFITFLLFNLMVFLQKKRT